MIKELSLQIIGSLKGILWLTFILNICLILFQLSELTYVPTVDNVSFVFELFAVENLIFAIWLHWSQQQSNLWRQLSPSDSHYHWQFLPVFVLLTVLLQWLPLIVIISFTHGATDILTNLDSLAFLWVWLAAWSGYIVGVALCYWKQWPAAILALTLPMFSGVFYLSYDKQLMILASMLLGFILFVVTGRFIRQLLIAVLVCCAISVVVPDTIKKLLPQPEGQNWSDAREFARTELRKFDGIYDLYTFYNYRSLDTVLPSLFYMKNVFQANWYNYKVRFELDDLQFNDDEKLFIENIWKNEHPDQIPVFSGTVYNKPVFVFKEAIYLASENANEQRVWQAANESEHITWVSRYQISKSGYSLFIFGNEQVLNVLVWTAKGDRHNYKVNIDGMPKLISVGRYLIEQEFNYRLLIMTEQNHQVMVNLDTQNSTYELIYEKPLDEVYFVIYVPSFELADVSIAGGKISNWLKGNAASKSQINVVDWVSHFLCVLLCICVFRQGKFKAVVAKVILCTIFAWPMLVALMLLFPKYIMADLNRIRLLRN